MSSARFRNRKYSQISYDSPEIKGPQETVPQQRAMRPVMNNKDSYDNAICIKKIEREMQVGLNQLNW